MRVAVPCFGQLRFRSLATGASLGFTLACGSSGDGGLFTKGQGGTPGSGGSASGGAVSASGGSVSTSGGQLATGGTAAGGSASGGDTTAGNGATSGGTSAGGRVASGGAAVTGGSTTTGGTVATTGGVAATGGAATTGGAVTTSGGSASGGVPSAGAAGAGSDGDAAGSGGTGGGCSPDAVERCDGLDNDCNGMVDEKACPTKCIGFALDDHGYMACNVEINATKASNLCEEQGLRMAWIESAGENAALLESIDDLFGSGRGGGIPEVSIGATDSEDEGKWHWRGGADFWQGGGKGSPVGGAYANWAPGRPNNTAMGAGFGGEDCAVLVIDQPDDGDPGEWNDVECSLAYGVLCEQP
jgi:hypothetical protein